MNPNERSKSALITGAADRLGLEMAEECLGMGYHVIIHYRSSAEPAQSVFRDDGRVTFVQAELTESPEKFMADVQKLPIPPLEGLINNAAVFQQGNMSDSDHFSSILTINALAPLKLSAAFAKFVKSGWIINVTDARTRAKNKKYQNYRVSKLFLDEITRQLAYLYAPSIRVNALAPGVILPPSGESKEGVDGLTKTIPLGKTGNPYNIRQALKFLIENDYVTGTIINVDGGWHL